MIRKLSLSFLCLALMVAGIAFGADAPQQDKAKKASQLGSGNPTSVKAPPSLLKIMAEYRKYAAQKQKVLETFQRVHATGLLGDSPHANLAPEDMALPYVKARIEILARFFGAQNDKGNGNIDYWIRTHGLLRLQAQAGMGAVNTLLQTYGDRMNGLLKAALKNVLHALGEASHKYDNGYGSLDYWVQASGYIRDQIWVAGRSLQEVADALTLPDPLKGTPTTRDRLVVIADLLGSQSDKGHGDIDYWIRTHGLLRNNGHILVGELQNAVQADLQMNGLLRTSINNVANGLSQAMHKFDNGYGSLDYWVSASSFVRDELLKAGRALLEILKNI